MTRCAVWWRELRPEIVSFHFGLPDQALLRRVKAAGCIVISSATIVRKQSGSRRTARTPLSRKAMRPAVIAACFLTDNIAEQPGTFALVPQVVDAVKVSVIAAGGIADGRGIAAAFALGAAGVQIGTAYLRCPESKVTAAARAALAGAGDDSTVITNVMTGRPARGVANRAMREIGPISQDAPAFPHAATGLAPLESGGGKAWPGRFHQSLGRAGGPVGRGDAGRRADPGIGRRGVDADEPDGWLRGRRAAVAVQKPPLLYGG